MTHYSIGQWTDFARNLVAPEDRDAMTLHLERDRCEQCRNTAGWVAELFAWAAEESETPVPAELTARAQAVFPTMSEKASSGVRNWMDTLERLVAECVFATSPQWLPEGVRSATDTLEQRFVYRAGTLHIDISIDSAASPGNLEITGQVQDQAQPTEPIEHLPVQLSASGKVIAEAETNQFGEFVVLVPLRNNISLSLALPDRGQRIEIPIHGGRS